MIYLRTSKYFCSPFLALLTLASFLQGSHWMALPLTFTVLAALLGDALLPAETSLPEKAPPTRWLNFFLYLNLPVLLLAYIVFFWQLGPWDASEFIPSLIGPYLDARKALTTPADLVFGFLGLGLIFGVAATNTAHELVHRTWSPFAQEVGRWLLALTWDSEFAIEHVYGHHRKVATFEDPASARLGENSYAFMLRSTIEGNRSAWQLEKQFLGKQGYHPLSRHNRLLRGWLYSAILAAIAVGLSSWLGLLVHLALAIYGKVYLELVNYIEHYGIVRQPKSPVRPHHSWNSNARMSSWFLFNLTRHSHHHEKGQLPYWRLEAKEDAPSLPFGYMAMILIALAPPLFRRVMQPKVEHWQEYFAASDC